MTLLQRICGCSEGAIHWRYGYHDFTKPGQMVAYRFWCLVEKVRTDWPHAFKWHLADFLSRLACKLRGHEVFKFGHYGGLEGNEAAMLADDLEVLLILEFHGDKVELLNECSEKLCRLAKLAHETWWHEKPQEFPKAKVTRRVPSPNGGSMSEQEQLIAEIVAAVAPFSDPKLAKRNLLARMADCEILENTPEALAWLRMMKRQTTASLAGCVPV